MLSSVPAYAITQASGYCGDGTGTSNEKTVSWSVDANGVLTLSGQWTPGAKGSIGYTQNFLREPYGPWSKDIVKIVIKKGVRRIGSSAFRGCSKVKEVVFEDKDNPIEFSYDVFYGCESLESFTFPEKTDYVGTGMFEKCYSLKSVKLHPGIKWIPQRFFKDCSSLGPEFILPETNTSIGLMAFELCSSLKKVVINDACEDIDNLAFRACYNLADITIGKSVAEFGEGAFWNTAYFSQRDIVIRDMATFVQAKFKTSETAGYWPTSSPTCYYSKIYIGDKDHPVTHIDIPEGATIIRSAHALFNIPEVKSITLPSTMKTLNGQALLSNEKTWDFIECWATTPPDVEDSGFVTTATYNRSTLYVPTGSVSAYKSHKNWGRFKNIVGKNRSEGVEDVTDNDTKVYASNGQIIVIGAKDGTPVEVYSIDGKSIYTGEDTAIDAPARGIYIVSVAGKTTKLAVN